MVAYESVKTKEKVQLGNLKSGRSPLRELFITKFKSQLKRGCSKESGKKTHYYKLSKINTIQDRDEAAELFWSLSSADC